MRTLFAATILLGVIAAVGGIAYGTIPDQNGVIHGCVQKESGRLRVIDSASDSCRHGEKALTWSQKGQQVTVYFNRDTDVLPGGTVRGYSIQCEPGDKAIGGGYDSDSANVTAFRSDVDLTNPIPAYLLGLKNNGATAANIQFTAYCLNLKS